MIVKLLTEHHLEFLGLKGGCTARLSLHLSKYHIVGNYMSRLIYIDTANDFNLCQRCETNKKSQIIQQINEKWNNELKKKTRKRKTIKKNSPVCKIKQKYTTISMF